MTLLGHTSEYYCWWVVRQSAAMPLLLVPNVGQPAIEIQPQIGSEKPELEGPAGEVRAGCQGYWVQQRSHHFISLEKE